MIFDSHSLLQCSESYMTSSSHVYDITFFCGILGAEVLTLLSEKLAPLCSSFRFPR